jgi:ABC-type nitrate/sulfonate/bicarbonate transport system substrate-binding protein
MTTREEYAEAAEFMRTLLAYDEDFARHRDLVARVLRQLAEGAVLCQTDYSGDYHPIEEPT